MLSLAQLFGYEQMNLFMLSLARKFGLHENSGYRLQWLVISEWFQQAPRGVCTMLKVGLLVQAQGSRKVAPSGGSKIIFDDFTGDKTMKMGMDIVAKRKCPCPLWGQDLAFG